MVALTTWGMFFSCLFFVIGMRLAYKKEEEINDSNKYNFFAAWKWYIIMFEMTMTMNIVITVVFWSVITQYKDVFNRPAAFLAYTSYTHSLPLVTFLFEYSLHTVPVIKRHIIIIFTIGVLYALINLTHTKISGNPIYPPLSWDTVASVMFGIGVVVFSVVSFSLLYFCN